MASLAAAASMAVTGAVCGVMSDVEARPRTVAAIVARIPACTLRYAAECEAWRCIAVCSFSEKA